MSPNRSHEWSGFSSSTAAFALLYSRITEELTKHGRTLPAHEARWFDALIDGFEHEFRGWEFNPRCRRVMESLEEQSSSAVRVIAFAYIHIAFDLPRVIAANLHSLDIPGARARRAYDSAREPLLHAFQNCCTDRRIFGLYGLAFRLIAAVPWLRRFSFAFWATELRSRAWSMAEQLAVSDQLGYDEENLWKEVEGSLFRAIRSTRNPLDWMSILTPPALPTRRGQPDVLDVIRFVSRADYDQSPVPQHKASNETSNDEGDLWQPKEGPPRSL